MDAGLRKICKVDGTVSWSGLHRKGGYLELWVHETDKEEEKYYCIRTAIFQTTAKYEQVCFFLCSKSKLFKKYSKFHFVK